MRIFRDTYSHCRHKIGLSLFEAETSRYNPSTGVRDEGLNDEDKGDDRKISEFLRRQLGTEFDEDCAISATKSTGVNNKGLHTQTWGKQHDVEVGDQFLSFCIEHARSGNNITGQADTHNLQHSFKNQEDEVEE